MCPAFCVCSFSLIKPTKLLAHGSAKRRRLIRLQYQRTLRVHILPRTIDRRRRLQSALEGHRDRSVSIVHQTDRRLAFPKLPNVLVQDDPFRILSIGPGRCCPVRIASADCGLANQGMVLCSTRNTGYFPTTAWIRTIDVTDNIDNDIILTGPLGQGLGIIPVA